MGRRNRVKRATARAQGDYTLQEVIAKETKTALCEYLLQKGGNPEVSVAAHNNQAIKKLVHNTGTADLINRLFSRKHNTEIDRFVISKIIELRQKYKSQPKEEESKNGNT